MTETKRMLLRLALRHEGMWWNAYIAQADTMDGARLIGSIAFGVVERNEQVKRTFMEAMRLALEDAIKNVLGTVPDEWIEEPAPESERSGHA